MKRWHLFAACLYVVAWPITLLAGSNTNVVVEGATWHDSARDRDVPVLIYSPKQSPTPWPVIVFSHGLGGSRYGYSYLGQYWAAHGYVVVHVQHQGSDDSYIGKLGWERGLDRAFTIENLVNRPKDVSFALDELTRLNEANGPWRGRLDLSRIGVAGHSFGAYTTMAIAGMEVSGANDVRLQQLADLRVKAAVAMSVTRLQTRSAFSGHFSNIKIPVFYFTGTLDKVRPSDSDNDKRLPFEESPGPNAYLVTFKGGDHQTFSGRQNPTPAQAKSDQDFQQLMAESTLQFWNTYLKNDATAREWMKDGGLEKMMAAQAIIEKK